MNPIRTRFYPGTLALFVALASCCCAAGAGSTTLSPRVSFATNGTTLVNGRPFFPIGLFTYSLDSTVMAELHKLNFNTAAVLMESHSPKQLDWLHREGLMALCPPKPEWLAAGTNHPAVLAWYIADEPEGHGETPEQLRERYLALRKTDPNHPVAIDHFLWEALIKYKDACDVTMTSIYPILSKPDMPITHVGLFIDHARSQHHPQWPHWPYLQCFGGPDTDGGKWREPEPAEERCMAYLALVHRANGIFYFSYWPRAKALWAEVGKLNAEIRDLTAWLVAPGNELEAKSSVAEVQVRARSTPRGRAGMILVVNTANAPRAATISLPQLPAKKLRGLFDQRVVKPAKREIIESLGPYQTRAYVWGKP